MEILVEHTAKLGGSAAGAGARVLVDVLRMRGEANIVVATGASQFDVLEHLVDMAGIDWTRITGFHLDEYVGLPMTHRASFRRYLQHRLVDRVSFKAFHYVDGEGDPQVECDRLGLLIRDHPIDLALVGIGENGHLAFNDPPADFATSEPYIVVTLDDACQRQQVDEGWFGTRAEVPERAISMSIHQIMTAQAIVCTVPERRKAEAVRAALQGPIGPEVPASILREHPRASIFLDPESASLLTHLPDDE